MLPSSPVSQGVGQSPFFYYNPDPKRDNYQQSHLSRRSTISGPEEAASSSIDLWKYMATAEISPRGRSLRRRDSNSSLLSERLSEAGRYHVQEAASRAGTPSHSRNQSPFRPESPYYDHNEYPSYRNASATINPSDIDSWRNGVFSRRSHRDDTPPSSYESPSRQDNYDYMHGSQRNGTQTASPPEVDRIMSDIYADAPLYTPSFQETSDVPTVAPTAGLLPQLNNVSSQRPGDENRHSTPAISEAPWTPEEDARLIAARGRGLLWRTMQKTHFPNRTVFECLRQYRKLQSLKGPHWCRSINPSTNNPCQTRFSSFQDLLRHLNDAHFARNRSVQCHLCTGRRLFNKNDTITKHYRIYHPKYADIDEPQRLRGAETREEDILDTPPALAEKTFSEPTTPPSAITTTRIPHHSPLVPSPGRQSQENSEVSEHDLSEAPPVASLPRIDAHTPQSSLPGYTVRGETTVKSIEKAPVSLACTICKAVSETPSKLRKHMRRHDRPYGCTFKYCDKAFGSKYDWRRHECFQHNDPSMYRCDASVSSIRGAEVCANITSTRNEFFKHIEECHPNTFLFLSAPFRTKLEARARKCLVGWDADHLSFWCGFCKEVISLPCQNFKVRNERFDHIAHHFIAENRRVDTWVHVDERIPAA